MMAGALNHMKLTILKRKLQAKRNAEAVAEEKERLAKLPGARVKAKMKKEPYENKAVWCADETTAFDFEPEPDQESPLNLVRFASATAENLAREEGLGRADFLNIEPSGKGGYTTADVRAILEGLDDE
jgi:hypothetical protein